MSLVHVVVLLEILLDDLVKVVDRLDLFVDAVFRLTVWHHIVTEQKVVNTWSQGSFLEKEMMLGTMPGASRRGRPRTAWMDKIKTWTGLPVEESVTNNE